MSPPAEHPDPLQPFARRGVSDFDAWHDGLGYDLEALAAATPAARTAAARALAQREPPDWRDLEALALLAAREEPEAVAALRRAAAHPDPQVRLAALRHAPGAAGPETRAAALAAVLRSAEVFGGLTQALLDAEEFHPPPVLEALLEGALRRDGESAVHLAALALYLHGGATAAFDWEHRPFFLRFATEEPAERAAAFRELCARCGRDPAPFLAAAATGGGAGGDEG